MSLRLTGNGLEFVLRFYQTTNTGHQTKLKEGAVTWLQS